MTTDPAPIEFTVTDDPRLIAAVGPIVSHASERAGLPESVQKGFAEAAVDACRETFPLLNGNDPTIKLIVADHPDRVEVTIEHSGEPLPSAGLDTFIFGATEGTAPKISAALLNTDVDRVKYETCDGRSRTILIKYLDGHRPKD